jgi:hypothetical protein
VPGQGGQAKNPNRNVTGQSDVVLISGSRVGSLQRVRYRRKLDTGDVCDRQYGAASRIVWGAGPVSRSAAYPFVVNTHGPSVASALGHGHGPVTGPLTSLDFTASPGVAPECLGDVRRSPVSTPATAVCVALITAAEPKTWLLTVENAKAYPNPPAWGVSWRFDGIESPVLVLQRGVKYTFVIAATPLHPFYIVDNDKGGRANASEVVYAGSAAGLVQGTMEAPYRLEWTPDASTPDLVYYQCVTHQKLGWRIYVADKVATFRVPVDAKACSVAETSTAAATDSTATDSSATMPATTPSNSTTRVVSVGAGARSSVGPHVITILLLFFVGLCGYGQ